MRLGQSVEVISVFNADGQIRPLRLRMMDEEQMYLRINIDAVLDVKEIKYVGNESHVFLCRGCVRGKEWVFELKYSIRSHNWSLLRKIS